MYSFSSHALGRVFIDARMHLGEQRYVPDVAFVASAHAERVQGDAHCRGRRSGRGSDLAEYGGPRLGEQDARLRALRGFGVLGCSIRSWSRSTCTYWMRPENINRWPRTRTAATTPRCYPASLSSVAGYGPVTARLPIRWRHSGRSRCCRVTGRCGQPAHMCSHESIHAHSRDRRRPGGSDGACKTDWSRKATRSSGAPPGREGVAYAQSGRVQLIILDVRLPDGSGFDFCRQLRELKLRQPILMLTVRRDETAKVLGLEMGADDYVTKPYSLSELLSRVRALLRRAYGELSVAGAEVLYAGDLVIDRSRAQVWRGQHLVNLTPTEFRLLVYLAQHPGQALSRAQILDAVWGVRRRGREPAHRQRPRAPVAGEGRA